MGEQIQVPITKAGKGVVFSFTQEDIDALPADVFQMVVIEGMKSFLNSRMSKLPATKDMSPADLEVASVKALEKAAENLRDLRAGKLVKKQSAASKATAGVDRTVMTEAIRLAKEVAKSLLREAGTKLSTVKAADLTAYAKIQVEQDPKYLIEAKANIARRAEIKPVEDITAFIKADPGLVAKAAADKAKRAADKPLSATQAGKPKKRGQTKPPPRKPGSVPPVFPTGPQFV